MDHKSLWNCVLYIICHCIHTYVWRYWKYTNFKPSYLGWGKWVGYDKNNHKDTVWSCYESKKHQLQTQMSLEGLRHFHIKFYIFSSSYSANTIKYTFVRLETRSDNMSFSVCNNYKYQTYIRFTKLNS